MPLNGAVHRPLLNAMITAGLLLLVACGGEGAPRAVVPVTPTDAAATQPLVACNDGSGKSDCCAAHLEGLPCADATATCAAPCIPGNELVPLACDGAVWRRSGLLPVRTCLESPTN
jgi:hypothetical protein